MKGRKEDNSPSSLPAKLLSSKHNSKHASPPIAMAPAPQSAYDGTWDSNTQKYVLPPLVGLPFSEMRKNGNLLPPLRICCFYPSNPPYLRNGSSTRRGQKVPPTYRGSWHLRRVSNPHLDTRSNHLCKISLSRTESASSDVGSYRFEYSCLVELNHHLCFRLCRGGPGSLGIESSSFDWCFSLRGCDFSGIVWVVYSGSESKESHPEEDCITHHGMLSSSVCLSYPSDSELT